MLDYVALLGPTASGKTKLSIELAKKYPIEIISVDSVSVYRGLDIGSAKPTIEERCGVPHHLIDVVDLDDIYTVAQFVNDANELIAGIKSRGNIPLFCGGTMMYAYALKEGLTNMPQADQQIRLELESHFLSFGLAGLYEILNKLDPQTAKRLKKNDKQRIIRALSLIQTHQLPLDQLYEKSDPPYQGCYVLQCIEDRALHRNKLANRVDVMLDLGFVNEVEGILSTYDECVLEHPAMKSIGYRQIIEYICKKYPLIHVREKIITASAQLVKKQMTWINSFKSHNYHRVGQDSVEIVLERAIKNTLERE
ncbi:tRNA (adenosine(37)-N6)-dimethylallyltransferase MiaA [Gammaproteobacteria bacterium]|nr:tRNA (adenosine(37)-N6)-dimethylallyltransferase MiaA [Gammaproteobacteria bacterium]